MKTSINTKLCLMGLLNLSALCLMAQPSRTAVHSSIIKTLKVTVAGEPLSGHPFIALDGGKRIEITFDALEQSFSRLAYTVEHCDAYWNPSRLSTVEYLDGFQGLTLNDFANSTATTTRYTNYRLTLPNDEVSLKLSGNYAVSIYRENEPQRILLTACFSLVEPLVVISGEVTGNTLTDFNNEHQQVDFRLDCNNLPVTHPQTDLKIFVYQNRRTDNAAIDVKPTTILNGRVSYDRNRALIFEAGNEYRRIEFLSHTYNGMGVEDISFHNPFYHVTLQTDLSRARRAYSYDEDRDGRFLIRCSRCDDPDTEADYDIVHFALQAACLPGGDVYLQGDIHNNVLDEKSRMDYNHDAGAYEKAILLKQGNYNYHYIFVPHGEGSGESSGQTPGQTAAFEGDYYQTENEYAVFVYYRPFGARYDRLVGLQQIRS
ncbi:MAG: DUF5103 domain-containing protein [Tannerellaceae bacterium]|jgi:hypothetical protein|nr:DUF5103 domain-containing protein [Tannerellaceae bacterium]